MRKKFAAFMITMGITGVAGLNKSRLKPLILEQATSQQKNRGVFKGKIRINNGMI